MYPKIGQVLVYHFRRAYPRQPEPQVKVHYHEKFRVPTTCTVKGAPSKKGALLSHDIRISDQAFQCDLRTLMRDYCSVIVANLAQVARLSRLSMNQKSGSTTSPNTSFLIIVVRIDPSDYVTCREGQTLVERVGLAAVFLRYPDQMAVSTQDLYRAIRWSPHPPRHAPRRDNPGPGPTLWSARYRLPGCERG